MNPTAKPSRKHEPHALIGALLGQASKQSSADLRFAERPKSAGLEGACSPQGKAKDGDVVVAALEKLLCPAQDASRALGPLSGRAAQCKVVAASVKLGSMLGSLLARCLFSCKEVATSHLKILCKTALRSNSSQRPNSCAESVQRS